MDPQSTENGVGMKSGTTEPARQEYDQKDDGGNTQDDEKALPVGRDTATSLPNDIEQLGMSASAPAQPSELKPLKFTILFGGMLLSNFLVLLDTTIVTGALTRIVSDFDALEQSAWLASAYLLSQPACILTCGQILKIANIKTVYITAIVIFEAGSLVCGAAPNMNVLIFGRALSGVGAACNGVASLSLLSRIVPLEKRAFLFGLFGINLALSSVTGPLVGGLLVDRASWRWCFYLNLPVGAICLSAIILTLDSARSQPLTPSNRSNWQRIASIDWIGSALCLGMMTSLLLPLQWGGVTKPWNDATTIACFCVFGVLVPVFVGWEWYMDDKGIMPLTMIRNKTQIGCCLCPLFAHPVGIIVLYYLPLYYQSAEEHSALRSGVDMLVFMISMAVGVICAGFITGKTGRPRHFLTFPPLLSALACGLTFWTLTTSQPLKVLLGLQVFLGQGFASATQISLVPIQALYIDDPGLVPQGISLIRFAHFSGGVIFIATAGAIFENRLDTLIPRYAPDLTPSIASMVKKSPAVIRTLHGMDEINVVRAYTDAIGYTFILGLALSVLASLASLMITNFDMRKVKHKPTPTDDSAK